jgi:hypothetical protein
LPNLLSRIDSSDNTARFELKNQALRLKAQLDAIELDTLPSNIDMYGNDEAGEEYAETSMLSKTDQHGVKHNNPEPSQDTIVERELRESGQIVLLSEITQLRRNRDFYYHYEMINKCTSILNQARSIKGQTICARHMRYFFPLKVVAESSPDLEQREKAEAILQRWKGLGGMTGMMKASIEDPLYQSDQ